MDQRTVLPVMPVLTVIYVNYAPFAATRKTDENHDSCKSNSSQLPGRTSIYLFYRLFIIYAS